MSTPTLRQLELAITLSNHQHFGRAAAAAHISQPGLSGQIGELERRLGIDLFERTTRGVNTTPAGVEILRRARTILSEVNDLVAAATTHSKSLRGMLRVAAIPTMAPYLLPTLVQTTRNLWPEVELSLHEMQTAAMVKALEQGNLDVGLLATPIDTGSLHVMAVCDEPFLLALPSDHPMAGDLSVPIAALRELPVLLLEDGHCLREHALSACNIAGDVEHHKVESASLSTISQMVAAGVGVTLLPATALAVETRPGSLLTAVPFSGHSPGRTIAVAWRQTDPRAPQFAEATEAFSSAIPNFSPTGAGGTASGCSTGTSSDEREPDEREPDEREPDEGELA